MPLKSADLYEISSFSQVCYLFVSYFENRNQINQAVICNSKLIPPPPPKKKNSVARMVKVNSEVALFNDFFHISVSVSRDLYYSHNPNL